MLCHIYEHNRLHASPHTGSSTDISRSVIAYYDHLSDNRTTLNSLSHHTKSTLLIDTSSSALLGNYLRSILSLSLQLARFHSTPLVKIAHLTRVIRYSRYLMHAIALSASISIDLLTIHGILIAGYCPTKRKKHPSFTNAGPHS